MEPGARMKLKWSSAAQARSSVNGRASGTATSRRSTGLSSLPVKVPTNETFLKESQRGNVFSLRSSGPRKGNTMKFTILEVTVLLVIAVNTWAAKPPPPVFGLDSRLVACASEGSSLFRAIASSAKLQVGVSRCGKLLVSTDQKSWRQAESAMDTFFRDVTFANGQFVAVGGSYAGLSGVILTSMDGEHWIVRRCGGKVVLQGVTCGNGLFVAVGDRGVILTSKNGVNWEEQSRLFDGTLASVAYGSNRLVAVGDDGVVLVSADGRRWTRIDAGTSLYLSSVKYDEGQFLVGSGQFTLQSGDGLAWTLAEKRTSLLVGDAPD